MTMTTMAMTTTMMTTTTTTMTMTTPVPTTVITTTTTTTATATTTKKTMTTRTPNTTPCSFDVADSVGPTLETNTRISTTTPHAVEASASMDALSKASVSCACLLVSFCIAIIASAAHVDV